MIPARPKVMANPSSGATTPPGKSDQPDANLGLHAVTTTTVRDAKEDAGATLRCIKQQVGSNGNPKHRDANEWGIGAKSIADQEKLK